MGANSSPEDRLIDDQAIPSRRKAIAITTARPNNPKITRARALAIAISNSVTMAQVRTNTTPRPTRAMVAGRLDGRLFWLVPHQIVRRLLAMSAQPSALEKIVYTMAHSKNLGPYRDGPFIAFSIQAISHRLLHECQIQHGAGW